MLVIAGHHGSGKTTLLHMLEDEGFVGFECSRIVQRLHKKDNPGKDVWVWMIDLRATHGVEYLASRIASEIESALAQQQIVGTRLAAVSGPRGGALKNALRGLLVQGDQIVLVWVDVAEDALYQRYNRRLLSEGQEQVERSEFLALLRREEQYGLSATLMKPNVYLDNNGTINEFQARVAAFVSVYKAGLFHDLLKRHYRCVIPELPAGA